MFGNHTTWSHLSLWQSESQTTDLLAKDCADTLYEGVHAGYVIRGCACGVCYTKVCMQGMLYKGVHAGYVIRGCACGYVIRGDK